MFGHGLGRNCRSAMQALTFKHSCGASRFCTVGYRKGNNELLTLLPASQPTPSPLPCRSWLGRLLSRYLIGPKVQLNSNYSNLQKWHNADVTCAGGSPATDIDTLSMSVKSSTLSRICWLLSLCRDGSIRSRVSRSGYYQLRQLQLPPRH